jgi:hypothetical protein
LDIYRFLELAKTLDSNHEDDSKPKWGTDADADDQANKEEVELPKNTHKAKIIKEKNIYNFEFDAAYFYSDEKNWLLDMVCGFLKDHKNIRGVELLDFYEELEEKTGFKVEEKLSQKELAECLKESMTKMSALPFTHLQNRIVANILSAFKHSTILIARAGTIMIFRVFWNWSWITLNTASWLFRTGLSAESNTSFRPRHTNTEVHPGLYAQSFSEGLARMSCSISLLS